MGYQAWEDQYPNRSIVTITIPGRPPRGAHRGVILDYKLPPSISHAAVDLEPYNA